MEWGTIGLIAFLIGFGIFLYFQRDRLHIQKLIGGKYPIVYLALLRTKVGLKFMDTFSARFGRILKPLSTFGIVIGFLGMFLVTFEVIVSAVKMFTTPAAQGAAALVLPIQAEGVIYVPFLIWLISLAIIVTIHEYGHGVIARLYKIPVKSTGLAALGIIVPILPAAFVEPDEKALLKAPAKHQLAVYAAGPFVNIIFAIMLIPLLIFATGPVVDDMYVYEGVKIKSITEEAGFPIVDSGLVAGAVATSINGVSTTKITEFTAALVDKKAGETVALVALVDGVEKTFSVTLGEHPDKAGAGYMGIVGETVKTLKEESIFNSILIWINELVSWLIILNLGIGLFNLLPIGIVDGGRMIKVAFDKYLRQHHATAAYGAVSAFCLFTVLFGVVMNFIK